MNKFLSGLVLLFGVSVSIWSCIQEDGSAEVAPNAKVKDPDGSVEIGLDAGGTTKIGSDIYISTAFNVEGIKGTYVASLGKVRGLGNVSFIPKDGWKTQVPAEIGNGYVAYSQKGNCFYRLFLSSELPDKSGFYVKYQGPFYGEDEAIVLSEQSISAPASGMDKIIDFQNKNIVLPQKVNSSSNWCRVSTSSSLELPFLINAIIVQVDNSSSHDDNATIELITAGNKVTNLQVNVAPYININHDISFSNTAASKDITVATNLKFESLSIKDNTAVDWCTASLQSGVLKLAVLTNANNTKREGIITISSGNISASITVLQEAGQLSLSPYSYYFNNTAQSYSVNISSNIDYSDLTISNNTASDWCSPSLSSSGLTVAVTSNENNDARSGVITVKAKNGDCSSNFSISQEAGVLSLAINEMSVTARNYTNVVNITSNISATDLVVKSNSASSWCSTSFTSSGLNLAFSYNSTGADRNGTIVVGTPSGDLSAQLKITQTTCPSNATDLGLSVYWANYNIDASSPEGYGGYYAWGETSTKSSYTSSTYNGPYNMSEISGSEYDVAHVKWGKRWRMPTTDEIKELVINCTWAYTTKNGIGGFDVTGPSGKTIFLPCADSKSDLNHAGPPGRYWSSTGNIYGDAQYLVFNFGGPSFHVYHKFSGFSVRPVSD